LFFVIFAFGDKSRACICQNQAQPLFSTKITKFLYIGNLLAQVEVFFVVGKVKILKSIEYEPRPCNQNRRMATD
jgi:hypothetical protein